MRMDLILEMMDVPGQLVSILNPISDLGANIVTVAHHYVAIKDSEYIDIWNSGSKSVGNYYLKEE